MEKPKKRRRKPIHKHTHKPKQPKLKESKPKGPTTDDLIEQQKNIIRDAKWVALEREAMKYWKDPTKRKGKHNKDKVVVKKVTRITTTTTTVEPNFLENYHKLKRSEYSNERGKLLKALYHEYLNSEQWKIVRDYILTRDNYRCVECGSRNFTQIHHKKYTFIYQELKDPDLLVTLCKDCHEKVHGIHDIPEPNKIRRKKTIGDF